jgi:SAM-dependent methyltransferase
VSDDPAFGQSYAAEQQRRAQHPVRRWVKGFYLRRLLREVSGPTVDYGCGAGQLLARLPAGSIGLELNEVLVAQLRARGHEVYPVPADSSAFDLEGMATGRYRSLVIAHVIEHLDDPGAALRRLLSACARLGIERVVVVVPGPKGFRSDPTHRVFVDAAYMQRHVEPLHAGYVRRGPRYFPLPWAGGGELFIYNEVIWVFARETPSLEGRSTTPP